MSVRLAIDIGGTFTDATLIDEDTGAVSIAKVLTTPADPSEGFMQAAERALAEGGVEPAEVTFVVHATTVATNAIIEGKIARSGFVTTDGFRDLLEIARQVRPTLYDTQFEKAAPLVPRDRAVVVRERLGPKGEVLRALEDDSVRGGGDLRRKESSRSPSASSTPTSTRSTRSGWGGSSRRSCRASRFRSRPRSHRSSASTCGPRPPSSTRSSGRSWNATCSGSRAGSTRRACRRSCS
jgi:hypothetical protein